jgi:hypothetical protein
MKGTVGSGIVRAFALVFCAALAAYRMDAEAADTSPTLFTPVAVVSGDSICAGVLHSTQAAFAAGVSWNLLTNGIGTGDDGLEAVETDTQGVSFITVRGSKIFIRLQTTPFCGGACEAQRAQVSTDPGFPDDGGATSSKEENATPYAPTWDLFKGAGESYYVAGIADGHVQVYRILAPGKFHLACDILAVPNEATPSTSNNPALGAVANRLHDFELALEAVTGETNGDCGSMATPSRWRAAVRETLLEIIYRPTSEEWSPPARPISSENSFGDYSRNIGFLQSWALGGVYEHRAFARYEEQFAATQKELASFYASVFHLAEPRAARLAQRNLEAAVSRGMGFYSYEPPFGSDAERRFREGVFDHSPQKQLESLAAEAWPQGLPSDAESIVALATSYPDALRILLDRGASPNVTNAFGKSPLMYAAQFNQPQSVELLLRHGADPNAATVRPEDTCNYQLKTTRVTPLHYAVRYASAKVVRLLLSAGAVTFRKTEIEYGGIEGYPLDWLARYTNPAAVERNPNIATGEISELQRLLQVPDDTARARLSDDLAHQAESDLARHELDKAYQKIRLALTANATNERAGSDLSLIALKTGHLGEALEAAEAIIDSSAGRGARAAAWFNRGLACEQADHSIAYDGKYFCMDSKVHPFLESWKAEPTPGRATKLRNVLEHGLSGVCRITIDQRQQVYYFAMHPDETDIQRPSPHKIYVLHPSDQSIDPSKILASADPAMGATISPVKVERDDLGEATLTVLEWQYSAPDPVLIYGQRCKPTQ